MEMGFSLQGATAEVCSSVQYYYVQWRYGIWIITKVDGRTGLTSATGWKRRRLRQTGESWTGREGGRTEATRYGTVEKGEQHEHCARAGTAREWDYGIMG
jgi:hypothetical protein